MIDRTELPYRPCVGVMLVNARGEAFVGQRIDNREGDFWQMPQGGIDPGEDLYAAALRELWEETGAQAGNVEVLAQSRTEHFYDLPDALLGKLWGGRYRGQRQWWILARFIGQDSDIRLDAHDPAEFCAWKWVAPPVLPTLIVPFKVPVYEAIVAEFTPLI